VLVLGKKLGKIVNITLSFVSFFLSVTTGVRECNFMKINRAKEM
jgi:hypothetical protein